MSKCDLFGLIYAGEQNPRLRELVYMRSVGALPIAGRYRAIDFTMSNMVNSGIRNIGVITQKNYHSLMDHLGSGKEWDLNRRNDGLFLFPPYDTYQNTGKDHGLVDAVKNVMDFIKRAQQNYCLLTGSFTIYNTKYNDMLAYHLDTHADITTLYNLEQPHKYGDNVFKDIRLKTDGDGRVTDMEVDSKENTSNMAGMDIYLMRKELLIYLVEEAFARGKHDFVREILIPQLGNLNVRSVEYSGYVGRLHSIESYFNINMDFLSRDIQREIFFSGEPVYTKIKDEVPAQYGPQSAAKNSLVANGCVIEGAVENSVIFRGVKIGRGSVVKNSIIMQNSEINENCRLENVILDKRVQVRNGKQLVSSPGYPIIVQKGVVL